MWFLIGSRAIKSITNDFYRNVDNSDVDLYCSQEDFLDFIQKSRLLEKCFPLKKNKYRLKIKGYSTIEVKIYTNNSVYSWLSQKSQEQLLSQKKYYLEDVVVHIPDLHCLKYIKQSHLYWPINWVKNVQDFTWLKEKTDNIPLMVKHVEFKNKIKKEMKYLHGKIPFGNLQKIPQNYHEIIQESKPIEYEKKVIYFIHEKLSLKQKINLINNWNEFDFLLKNPITKHKKIY